MGSEQGQNELVFETDGVDQDADRQRMWGVRRHVLGTVLAAWRADKGLSVQEAADLADIAPMTWRRLEQGMSVRRRTLTALDGVLAKPLGTVTRALADDYLMVSLAGQAGVVSPADLDDDPAVVLDRVVAHGSGPRHQVVQVSGIASAGASVRAHAGAATGTGRAGGIEASTWPVVDEQTRRALVALSMHVPATRPTVLETVQAMVAQLAPLSATSSAIADAVRAAVAALPDVIARTVVDAGSECDVDEVAEREAVSA